jgi:hypothetical protein
MDKSFKTAVAFYKPIAQLTHQQEVMRLYRRYVNGSLVGHRPTSGDESAQGLCLMHQAVLWASMLFSPGISVPLSAHDCVVLFPSPLNDMRSLCFSSHPLLSR